MSAVQRPWWSLADLVHHVDLVHVTYYAAVKLWTAVLGHSVLAFRSLSAVFLAVGCGLGVLVAGRVVGDRAARWAALWFVLFPGLTWAGFDARSSALSVATTMAATWLLLCALDAHHGSRHPARWIAYGAALVLTICVQLLTVLIVIPHAVIAARRGRLRAWAATIAVVAVLTAPFAVAAHSQGGQLSWLRVTLADALPSMLWSTFVLGLRRLHEPWWAIVGSVLIGVAAWSMVILGRGRRDLWVWAFAPAAVAIGWSLVTNPVYQERYFTWTVPAFAMLAALGCARHPRLGAIAVVIATAGALLVGVSQRAPDAKYGQNYDALARWVTSLPRDTDLVVTQPGSRAAMLIHPAAFAGMTDRSRVPGRTPVSTGTFWGQDENPLNVIRTLPDPAHVLVLHETRRGVDLIPIVAALRARGCTETSRFDVLRTGGVLFTCHSG